MKGAHKRAIEITKQKGGIISFDPNLRFPLWDNHEELKKTVLEFCKYADIIKVSDEEIDFLAGTNDPDEAAAFFLGFGAKVVFVTLGKAGANMYAADKKTAFGGYPTTAVDTTGAGDIFIGTALSAMEKLGCDLDPTEEQMEKTLKIACYASSLSVRCKGATYDLNALLEKFPEMK
jgi:fructokinase